RDGDSQRFECAECLHTKTRYLKNLKRRRNNPDRVQEYNVGTRPLRLRYQARWARENPEAAALKNRRSKEQQRAKDPVAYRSQIQASTNRRRAHKANNGQHDLTRHQWDAIKIAYGHACAYCHATPLRLSIDHVWPLRP